MGGVARSGATEIPAEFIIVSLACIVAWQKNEHFWPFLGETRGGHTNKNPATLNYNKGYF